MKFGEVETSDQVFQWLKGFGNQYLVERVKVPYKGLAEWEVDLAFKHTLSNYFGVESIFDVFKSFVMGTFLNELLF